MSAHYEISEGELDVLAITGPEGTRYIDGEEIEARVIRQQSADIAELRAELAAAVAERDRLRDSDAFSRRELARGNEIIDGLRVERDQLRARLAAIDNAPPAPVAEVTDEACERVSCAYCDDEALVDRHIKGGCL